MKCLILASLFVVTVSLVPAYAQIGPQLTGTCASIGYSTSCCPVDAPNCQATDGNCRCGSNCHTFGDCCSDVSCPSSPRTCADVGIYQCCTDRACDVRTAQHYCSCNITCHARGDCCTDALTLCIPQTCAHAGKPPGCCQWGAGSSCYISGMNCYCDSYCHVFNDCCSDVPPGCSSLSSSQWSQSRLQSALERELTASHVQNYYRGRGVNIESDNRYAHHRMALAARTQRVRGNTASYREFGRGRARVASRPHHPPPYNY